MRPNLISKLLIMLALSALLLPACAAPAPIPPTAAPAMPPTATAAPTVTPFATAAGWLTSDNGRVQFSVGESAWHTEGDLPPQVTRRFTLYAEKGQTLNVSVATQPESTDAQPLAAIQITAEDGSILTPSPVLSWSGQLPYSADYTLDVIAMSASLVTYTLSVEIPPVQYADLYTPIPPKTCATIQEILTADFGIPFEVSPAVPFTDPLTGENGQGCLLSGSGDGTRFTGPTETIRTILDTSGFDEQTGYQADGPTGSATAAARDTALMLIQVKWAPSADANCPADQPISACPLTPAQKIYRVEVNTAQYRVTYCLPGQWQDAAGTFSLDLSQEWRHVYGSHSAVAQNGGKIDALDASIDGFANGKTAAVTFKSSFSTDTGTAEISCVDADTIHWKMTRPPAGEYYLPSETDLKRR